MIKYLVFLFVWVGLGLMVMYWAHQFCRCNPEPRYAEAHIEVGTHDEVYGIVVYADGTVKELP